MGRAKLNDLFIILDNLTRDIPIEELEKVIRIIYKSTQLEREMQETISNFANVMKRVKTTFDQPKIRKDLEDYKHKKEISAIRNKKRWDRGKFDKNIDESLDNLGQILQSRMALQRIKNKSRDEVKKIEQIFQERKDKIPINRERRKKIENILENVHKKEKDKEFKEIGSRLHDLFKKD